MNIIDELAFGQEAVQRSLKILEQLMEKLDTDDRHIDKENRSLFQLTRQHIPNAQLASIKTGFDRIESDRVGAGRHEAFHAKPASLAREYP